MYRLFEKIGIKQRIAVAYAGVLALTFVVIGITVYKQVERDLLKSIDSALVTSAEAISENRTFSRSPRPFLREFLEEVLGEKMVRQNAQIVDMSGRISASTNKRKVSFPVSGESLKRAESGKITFENIVFETQGEHRLITMPMMIAGRFTGELIQVATPIAPTKKTLSTIKGILFVTLSIAMAISFLVAYIVTGSSLRPVATMAKTASKLGIHELSTRIKLPVAKDEIRELASTFNGMLDRLEDAFSRLKRFSGDVSHELRTPIAVVRGEAEFALRKKRSAEEYEESLKTIADESKYMTGIIEDLLLLARANSKSVAMRWEEFSAKTLAEEVRGNLQPIMAEKNISMEIVDQTSTPLVASFGYITLSLSNIVSNAVKHSPKGSNISVKLDENKDQFELHVIDQGQGIDPEAIPYIFDPFFREDTVRNRKAGGTGIGLSLAKALVAMHGGDIRVESKVGEGSTFSIVIPKRVLTDNEKESSVRMSEVDKILKDKATSNNLVTN